MAKSAEPKKATKAEKVKKVKAAGLSEDLVVDSDSESEQKPEKSKSPAKAVEKTKKPKTTTKKAAVPPPPPPPPAKEESSDSDSDDLDGDDESTASESEAVEKKAVNGVKRKADEASSSSSSEEEESSEAEETQPAAKKAKTQANQPKKPAAISPADSEDPTPKPLSSIPAAAFSAPKDFHPIDLTKSQTILHPNILQGKQIWHITAPSSLPISEIKSVGLDAIANGSTVLTHKGSAYSLSEDTSTSSTSSCSVFLPANEGYKASEMPVAKTLRLHQKIELPKLGEKQARTETGGEAAADVWATAKVDGEGVRPQPKGMRMRYKPPGFGLGEPGLGSDDDEEGEDGVKLPKTKKAKKERRESGEGMEGVEMTGGKVLSKEERKKAKKEAKARAAAAS